MIMNDLHLDLQTYNRITSYNVPEISVQVQFVT